MTATWTAPRTWADNDLVAAADLNEQLRDNLEYLGGLLQNGLIVIEDQKANGTAGGTFTAGAWQTRDLNTEVSDDGSHASLASNQITLAAGTYEADISAPAHWVSLHQARLQNITDGTTTLLGSSEYTYNGIQSRSVIRGRFTIASSKVFEVQHQCSSTHSSDGLGKACSFGTEVYTIVVFRKVT